MEESNRHRHGIVRYQRGRTTKVTGLVAALLASVLVVVATDSPAISDPSAGFLDGVPSTTPSNLGDLDLTEMQYGDPTEALGLVQPPKAGPDGSAGLAHPLPVPPGRAGVQPDLALSYDSSGGSGWAGTGWDLSVGAVTVDTAFGAPRYLTTKESETYQLDGDRLFPNAIRTDLQDRASGPRADWVRELEDEHDLIVRHGTSPSTYCWQVADKKGNQRWYGGTPNDGGGCDRDASTILTAPATGAHGGGAGDFHWALAYVQDISGNTMRFTYDKVTGVPMGRDASSIGVSFHLRHITYTGFALDTAPDHPAYRVRFLRDGDVTGDTRRLDVSVDASAGLPVVTRDLLRGVEVEYLSPAFHTAGASPQRVKGWTLEYENGPYDKSLLTSVGQYGTGGRGTEHAWHRFTWFDDVRDPATGAYRGFGDVEQWGNRTDSSRVNIAAESALGTSYRGGADGGAYIGFNPVIPNKIGSFGGSFNIAGGQTNESSTLVDLDGDSLADKVWVTADGTVMYRPNLNRPGAVKSGDSWFGEAQTISGINSLGQSSDLKVNVHFEAYPVVAIQVGGGFGFSFGDRYFADANGDGRVDFVKPGDGGAHTIFYNVLVAGVPTFIDSSLASQLSDKLEVPLDAFDSSAATESIAEVAELLVNTSPRIDTVRRWIAPHSGTIRVQGSPVLRPGAPDRGDGVLVTIEHGGDKKWEETLTKADPTAPLDEIIDVTAGQSVWFRLHVIQNAADDVVDWSPKVTYTSFPAQPPDANGRSQLVFDAAVDFTLFGRSGARTALSKPGPLTINVKATTHAPLSDELRVAVLRGRGKGAPTTVKTLTVPQWTAGVHTDSVALTIAAPSKNLGADNTADTSDDYDESDWIEVRVDSDSPVDPTKYSIELTTDAPAADTTGISDIPSGANVTIPVELPVVPNVQVFSRTDHTEPYRPIRAPANSAGKVDVVVGGSAIDGGKPHTSRAVVTVKTVTGGVRARKAFTVNNSIAGLSGSATLDFTAAGGTDYYVDVSVADPVVGAAANLQTSAVSFGGGDSESNGQLHWPDIDGIFPSGNRGWAFAGYNADHADAHGSGPLVEGQFKFSAPPGGYDEDTPVPTASQAPSAADVKAGATASFDPALPYIPWAGPGSDVADRWRAGAKETLHGKGSSMQADRLGADIALGSPAVTGRAAPQILGLDGDFNFMLGLIASFSAAAGGGRTLKDFEDYNGDGLPDIRSGSTIEYTGPRGAKAATTGAGGDSFDTGIGVEVGLGGSPLNISSSGGANKNNDGGGAGSNVEPTSTKSSRGLKIGLGFGLGFQWTNPVVGSEAFTEAAGGGTDAPDVVGDQAAVSGTVIDRSMIDMNGDGLPDRVDTYTNGELLVSLNLGYRFASQAVKWSTGRTSANQDVGGSLSVGFQLNAYEFAGGVAYSEAVGLSLFDWMDVDGDGIPDRMNNSGSGDPLTVFGSGDGMQRPETDYGTYFRGNVAVDADRWQAERDADGNLRGVDLPDGQMEVSRSTSLTGGADFSFYIGPICLVGCYIVVNPGVHGGYDRMTSQVQMVDVNGDGALDAVRSTDYEHVEVRLNLRGRTNLLRSVTNPLGGQIRVDYERTGNTRENPESLWVMSSIEFDDGRSGDGPDVQRSEFSYDGDVWDRLLREQLGFSSVREEQVERANGTRRVLRSYERNYLNGNLFESGLLVEERMFDGSGRKVQASSFEWSFANADPGGGAHGSHGARVVDLPKVNDPARTLLFDTALSPLLDREELQHWDAQGDSQLVRSRYTYNTIGDVLTVHDENEHEIDADDTFTVLTYSECAVRDGDRTDVESWVSVPATVTVFGNDRASGEILKYRNGGPSLCANSVPLRIAEMVDPGVGNPCGPLYAVTELSFDTHGSYDAVAHPANVRPGSCAGYPPATVTTDDLAFEGCGTLSPEDSAVRYCLDYVYDDHRRTDVGLVTDNHGVSSSASYDPLTGRLASRSDENDNVTTYGYDPQGRLTSVTAPREQGSGTVTVAYSYGGLDATLNHAGAHTWATSHHHDVFNAGNSIDTATFVDGMGRIVQRKRDAQVDGVAGQARVVEGAIEYDALGHEVKEWYPVVEKVGVQPLTMYNTSTSESGPATTAVPLTKPTVRTFTVLDQLATRTLPDDSIERFAYDFDPLPDPLGAYTATVVMSRVVTADTLGKTSSRWVDVGGAVFFRQEDALGANNPDGTGGPLAGLPTGETISGPRIAASTGTPGAIKTLYEYDRLGRLTAAVDAAGARTTHAYDPLDNVTATSTPDAGVVQRRFAPSGQLLTVERAKGTVATYAYNRDRMIGVSYSDNTPPVAYEYGADAAPENGAGRVTRVGDGAMTRTYGYDVDGNVARETATQHPNPFGKGINPNPATWQTAWEYDSLGRLRLLTYPDGEALTHDYDLGGRPATLVSQAPQHDLYDQYGNAVARPDVEITYVGEVRYDQFGQATYLRTGTGVETSYTHDPKRRFLAGIRTDATASAQYDGSTAVARPLQRLEYTYDKVGNVRDVVNRLYADPTDTTVAALGPAPVNNVPGPSQHAYTYDGHYRLTGGAATYVDQQERRDLTYQSDYAPNGNLLSKRQVTTTTSTTSKGGKTTTTTAPAGSTGNGKKGDGSGTGGGTTTENTCESNTGSGGGAFNQDPETTYVIAPGDLAYATDAGGHRLHRITRSGTRNYTHDANGNMTGWVQPCAGGTSTITRTIEWDAENRVTRLAEGTNDTLYRYSAEGHRTLERGPQGTNWFVNEHWRTFNDGLRYANVFLGQQMIASHRTDPQPPPPPPCTDTPEIPCSCQQNGACEVPLAECNLATRVYDATTGTCQPKERRTIHFLHKDLQGSLRVATDEVGVVFQYVDYLPTGRPWVAGQSTTKDTPYMFAGGWTDTTYDLVNFGERWYDEREQNFLSAEPLLEESPYAAVDDPSLLSAYTYAASNPLKYVDPDGRAPKLASNGFDLGDDLTYEKHESGNISIPVASREARAAPAITFGGRYSNDAATQASVQKMVDLEAKIQRFATLLNIETEDGERKIHVFGKLVDKRKVGDHAAPDPGPSDTGAKPDDGLPAPPDPSGVPDSPGADDAASGSDDDASSSRSGAGASDGAGDAGAGAPSPDAGSGSISDDDGSGASTPPPLPPRRASPSAGGDSDADES